MATENRTRVLQFASVINRHDFIDTIVRHADPKRFQMMTCSYHGDSNIASAGYGMEYPSFSLGVHTRRDYAAAIGKLSRLLRRESIDIIHAHHFDEAGIAAAAVALVRKVRLVVGRHYHDEIYLLSEGLRRKALLAIESIANRMASVIVVPSTVIRALLINRQHVSPHKLEVIPYGIEFEAEKYRRPNVAEGFRIREELGFQGRFVVGNFGRHHVLKGQEFLIHAFARFASAHPEAVLLMVGDGPHSAYLRSAADALGLTRARSIVFLGWRRDAWRLMEAVDVIVHPTLHEALPQLMIEAMAKERPLIITNVSGVCDFARDGENALVIPQRDEEAIMRALERVRSDSAEAEAMGWRARQQITGSLHVQRIIPRFESLYDRVVTSSGSVCVQSGGFVRAQ